MKHLLNTFFEKSQAWKIDLDILNYVIYLLGATPILERGLADDQHDLGQDFVIDPWMRTLCKNVCFIASADD